MSGLRSYLGVFRILLTLVAATAVGACDDAPRSPTAPSPASTPLTPALTLALDQAILDEYRAETTYQAVIADFGQVLPFVNVLTAEERHSSAIGRLYANRGLTPPPNPFTLQAVPHFATVAAACVGGATAERANISLYDALLAGDLPVDVRQVFTSNRAASADNHLPAFLRCA